MENLKKQCIILTQENVDALEAKYYANGTLKKAGDLLLYVMLIEDDSKEDKTYHCVTLNFNDLGEEYKFTGRYFDENNENSGFYFPIVEGKLIKPEITSLKEFNDYLKHFPTNFEKREYNYYLEEGDLVMFANDIPLNYEIINTHNDSFFEKIKLDEYKNKVGVVKRCWEDLHTFANGSIYMVEIDFNGKIITNFAQLFLKFNLDNLLQINGIELLEWIRTFKSLEKKENEWILGRQISSEQLYEGYLNDREQWRKNKHK